MKASPFDAAALLLTASFAFAPSGAALVDPLAADAGVTQVSFDQADLVLAGKARGGVAPYAYAWTGAAASRFSDPASASPVFSTVGLPVGNLTLTLTVPDFLGTVVSDTGKLAWTTPPSCSARPAPRPPAWTTRASASPSTPAATRSSSRPARVSSARSSPGTPRRPPPPTSTCPSWASTAPTSTPPGPDERQPRDVPVHEALPGHVARARRAPRRRQRSLRHRGAPGQHRLPPRDLRDGPLRVRHDRHADPRRARSRHRRPYSFEWDFDHDGWFETPGEIANASLPVGVHTVTVRATDANGFSAESATLLTVRDADVVQKLVCGGDASFPYWAMEFSASRGTCWIHGGHHTDYMRGTYAFQGATGLAYAVEQEFAPSLDAVDVTHPLDAPVYLEVSLDGLAWTEVGRSLYAYGPQRQYVWFDVAGAGQPFRFVRIHAPLSASQGLSGYLDHPDLRIAADALVAGVAASSATTKSLRCQTDVMEDFFATHPCWFGGVDRYDAPSFYHTYPVGGSANLTRVSGSFTLGPWRSDDFFDGTPLLAANKTKAFVQVSTDGMAWTDVATIHATYGVAQTFNVTLPGTQATFVRLFPEHHANFDAYATLAPHHHPRAYFLDSCVTLEGAFVEWV